MSDDETFLTKLEGEVQRQLGAQRVGFLLGAGSSYLDGEGYPLASELWHKIRELIPDTQVKAELQCTLDNGANGIEQALDLLDDGSSEGPSHRMYVVEAIADCFMDCSPPLESHKEFLRRLSKRANPFVKVFSLNYDPLVEQAASNERIRLTDGFLGAEPCYFNQSTFHETAGLIRGTFKTRIFDQTVKPIHLIKLHGSLGWYNCRPNEVRRCNFNKKPPEHTTRLMIPPQQRKAADTMFEPYSALWSEFRGSLGQDSSPLNRLVCIGYGLADAHVNTILEGALSRSDFTLLVFSRSLSDRVWGHWNQKQKVIIVTRSRSSLYGEVGPGHSEMWSFDYLKGSI